MVKVINKRGKRIYVGGNISLLIKGDRKLTKEEKIIRSALYMIHKRKT